MSQNVDYLASESRRSFVLDGQKKAIEDRREVQHLYFEKGYTKDAIATRLNVSKGFVVKWTQDPSQDIERDCRGWPKGKHRSYDPMIVERVRQLHERLVNDRTESFTGASAIELAWRAHYPNEQIPSLSYIGRIMSAQGLTSPRRGRHKGALQRLCYPENTLHALTGSRLLESDFVGQKFLRGGEGPLNFIGFSFKKEPRLRWYYQVEAQSTNAILSSADDFFERFEVPDAIKVDNAAAMHGTTRGRRCLSRFHYQMLSKQIFPVHAVPRRPATQASIEGSNSVFSRFFWNKREFTNRAEVTEYLGYFNSSSERYLRYRRPLQDRPVRQSWTPAVYYLRQVRQTPDQKRAAIDVMHELIELDPKLIGYFVLAQWDLDKARLNIILEKEHGAEPIASVPFEINKNSTYRF